MSQTDWGVWGADTQTDVLPKKQIIEDKSDGNSFAFNDLSEYEMIKIFSYFTIKERIALSSVCLKWKNCIEKSFKSEPVLDLDLGISERAICLLIQKCCNVRHISLRGMFSLRTDETESVDIIETIVSNCSQLQSIDFGHFDGFDDQFIKNANYFRRLKKICSKYIGEKALNCIIDSQNLESIDIKKSDISRLDFKRLGPKIRELILIDSEVFENDVIKGLTEGNGRRIEILTIDIKEANVLPLICDNLLKLKEFKICLYSENCNFRKFSNLKDLKTLEIEVMDSSRLKSQDFSDLIRSLNETRICDLRVDLSPINNIAITDESLQEIRVNCPSIEKLVIRGTNSLTGPGMYAISQMKNIRHLDLKDCRNISDQIEIIITSCPLLRELILHKCSYITNSTVAAFIEKAKELPKEKFYLDVIDTNVSEDSLPIVEERPNNLKLLYDNEDCIYDCDHGWGDQNGYNSGPEDFIDVLDELDYFVDEDINDYYDDYGDEDIDYEFS